MPKDYMLTSDCKVRDYVMPTYAPDKDLLTQNIQKFVKI